MNRWKFAVAVGVTSLALVAVLGVAGVLVVRSAVASAAPWAAGWGGPFGGTGFQVPAELQGLANLPPAERFAHFVGVQVNLKDQDNKPLTINVTPGTVTGSSATSLAIAANDGTSKTFTLNDATTIKRMPAQSGGQPSAASPANGDQVVVVTMNGDTTARAVIDGGKDGFAAGGPHGWGGWHR